MNRISVSLTTFPILGGRLLKYDKNKSVIRFEKVSNPWREAIEGG